MCMCRGAGYGMPLRYLLLQPLESGAGSSGIGAGTGKKIIESKDVHGSSEELPCSSCGLVWLYSDTDSFC